MNVAPLGRNAALRSYGAESLPQHQNNTPASESAAGCNAYRLNRYRTRALASLARISCENPAACARCVLAGFACAHARLGTSKHLHKQSAAVGTIRLSQTARICKADVRLHARKYQIARVSGLALHIQNIVWKPRGRADLTVSIMSIFSLHCVRAPHIRGRPNPLRLIFNGWSNG